MFHIYCCWLGKEKKTRNPKCSYLFYLKFILMFCSISSINNGFKCATVWVFNKNLLAILSSSLLCSFGLPTDVQTDFHYTHTKTRTTTQKKKTLVTLYLQQFKFVILFFFALLFYFFFYCCLALFSYNCCTFTLLVFLLFVVAYDALKQNKKKLFVRFIYPKHFQFIAMHSKWNLVTHALLFLLLFLFVGCCVLQAKVPLKYSTKPCF